MIVALGVVLAGLFIGLTVGATGVGAGTLGAPFLIFVLKVDPFTAVGTDLFMNAVIKAAGSLIHRRADNVDTASVLPLAVSAVGGSLAGLALLVFLRAHADAESSRAFLRHGIGVIVVICAVAIAFSSRIRSGHSRFDKPVYLGIMGTIVAAITAVTGVGVGSLSIPALYFIKGRARVASIVGTSLVYAAFVTVVSTVGHIALRDINYPLAGLLLVGALPGVAVGSKLATRAPSALKPVIVALLMLSGLRLIA